MTTTVWRRIIRASVCTTVWLSVLPAMAQQLPPVSPRTVETLLPPPPIIPTTPLPADVPVRPLNADEAARIAVAHQPTLEAARQAIVAARARTEQARAATLPSVTLGASYTDVESLNTVNGISSVALGSSSAPGYAAATTLRQLLYDFSHTRDLVRQSTLLERVAQDNLLRVRYDLVLETRQGFYQYANNVRALKISEDSLASRQKQLALARARLKSGLGLPSDVARAETSAAQGVATITTTRQNASLARINLALIMGIDPRTPLDVDQGEGAPVVSADMNAMVTTALKQRPEMLEADDILKSAKYGVSAARSGNAPNFGASIGVSTRGTNFPPVADTFSVGISVNWNPFDGGLTSGHVKEARANQATAVAQKESTRLGIISDVAQAYASMRDAEQRIGAAQNEVANAREGLRIAEGRFASGLGIFLDIVDAETALETAQNDLTLAQLSVSLARSALSHAVGAPIPGVR